MKRRDFLRDSARHAAAAAIPLAGAAAAGGADLYHRLSEQLGQTAQALQARLDGMSATFGTLSERVDLVELKYRVVMALLVLSLIIDGGMSWMILSAAPVAPVPVI